MKKINLINLMNLHGIKANYARTIVDAYLEISSFSYLPTFNSTSPKKYVKAFGKAYNSYGLYIFYDHTTMNIVYIGEAASEPFSKRLSQHFNKSHGGLIYKNSNNINILKTCEVLILYGKYGSSQGRETHFDEDLLIGIFRPLLNDR